MEEKWLTELRDSYNKVASQYTARIYGELAHKPYDRALLDDFAEQLRGRAVTSLDHAVGGHRVEPPASREDVERGAVLGEKAVVRHGELRDEGAGPYAISAAARGTWRATCTSAGLRCAASIYPPPWWRRPASRTRG